jgi:hypothetical protein
MTQGKRFGLSAAQKRDMWCRWKAGDSLHRIGRAFGKEHSSIRCLVSRHGGFVPAIRRPQKLLRFYWFIPFSLLMSGVGLRFKFDQ